MVLSNKKMKRKLRAAVAESLTVSEAQTERSNNDSTQINGRNSQTHESLKALLVSATQKARLSKREKRRKTLSLQGAEVGALTGNGDAKKENGKNESEIASEEKKTKKRKRDEGLEAGVAELTENAVTKTGKKLKKKKKKKKKAKKAAKEEVKNSVEDANGGQVATERTKPNNSQENAGAATKVYVGGIPYYSTEDDIRSYFDGCGTIIEVDCMTFPDSGKFRGIAIISFKTEAAAKRALALDGADMGGLFLKIQPYESTKANKAYDFTPPIVEGYNRIYVGNLSWDITEDELRELFSDCTISSIRFGEDKETGEFRGYAHVDFADSLSVTMALKLDQKLIRGRPVRIRCAVPKKVSETNSKSMPTSKAADSEAATPVSGKIRRRTCYECGEKGHLSSSCPKKQSVDAPNSTAD